MFRRNLAVLAVILGVSALTTPFLVGHSLGTLATIFTAWAPASIRGLLLHTQGNCTGLASDHPARS